MRENNKKQIGPTSEWMSITGSAYLESILLLIELQVVHLHRHRRQPAGRRFKDNKKEILTYHGTKLWVVQWKYTYTESKRSRVQVQVYKNIFVLKVR